MASSADRLKLKNIASHKTFFQSQIRDEMAMKMREMEQVAASTVQREISLGMKERHVEQLAEDYRLEIHEMKAKLTNSSFQG